MDPSGNCSGTLARRFRRTLFPASLIFFVVTASGAEQHQPLDLAIRSQRTDGALLELARDAGVQIMFAPEIAQNTTSPPVQGRLTVSEAMDILLEDTPLSYQMMSDKLVIVGGRNGPVDREASSAPLLLAQATTPQANESSTGSSASGEIGHRESRTSVIEEIIVTAQKREQNLQDVALSVSALSSTAIDRRGLVEMSDYLNSIPGVTMTDRGSSRRSLIIRGMAVDPTFETGAQSTVGFYLGDLPLSNMTAADRGTNTNPRLVDIERIEVLRGPQGTLYGASSLSGTVRYIPKSPNLSEVEARVGTEISHTEKAGEPNTMLQGVINVPLVRDRLAFRGVAYSFSEAGYIDDIGAEDPDLLAVAQLNGVVDKAAGHEDVGGNDVVGARGTLLWQPVDRFTAELVYAFERQRQKGIPEVQPDLPGNYQQSRIDLDNRAKGLLFAPGGRGNQDEMNLFNLVLDYDWSLISLHSSTSYARTRSTATFSANGLLTDFSILDLPWEQHYRIEGLAQELRLATQFDGPFQAIVGFYYDDLRWDATQQINYGGDAEAYAAVVEPAFGPNAFFPLFFSNVPDVDQEQESFFGEITYRFLDRLEATFGARRYDYHARSLLHEAHFPFLGTPPVDEGPAFADDDGVSLKAGLSFEPDDDMLFYGQWSEGFRQAVPSGGFEEALIPLCDTDSDGIIDQTAIPISAVGELESDTAESYELGAKLSGLLNGRVQINAALYQVNWDGLPLSVRPPCGALFALNASEARSRGFEVETNVLLTDHLLLNLNAAYVDAELTKDAELADIGGGKGDPLPGSADFTFMAGLQYDFEMGGYPAYVNTDVNYVGGFYSTIQEAGAETGDYWLANVRAGVTFNDSITVEAFVKNVTGSDELTWQEVPGSSTDERAYRLSPRSYGMSVRYDL